MAVGSDTKHVDVTMAAELHARLSRDAERRGMTLAGYLRHAGAALASRTLDGAQQPDVGQVVAGIDRRLRALLGVLVRLHATTLPVAVVNEAGSVPLEHGLSDDARDALLRQAAQLYTQTVGEEGGSHGEV